MPSLREWARGRKWNQPSAMLVIVSDENVTTLVSFVRLPSSAGVCVLCVR